MTALPPDEAHRGLRALGAARWRRAILLTGGIVVLYFGFIALIAFNKPFLARLLAPGVSVGIVLGAVVIVASWVATYVYVRWANTRYDTELDRLRG